MSARLLASVAVSVTLGWVVFADMPAQAAVTHHYLSQIEEVPAGSGVELPGPVTEVDSMTVDSGHLWVAEHVSGTSSYRTDEFDDATGAFMSQLPQVSGVEEVEHGVAVGHATGEAVVYVGATEEVAGEPEGAVAVFGASGALQATPWIGADTPEGSFGRRGVRDVAVDNSRSPADWAAGDVYVATNSVVDVFKPEAGGKETYVTQLTGAPSEPFSGPEYLAVDEANGDVLVADGGTVDLFAPAALADAYEFVRKITGPPPSGSFGDIRNIAVDGGDGDVYVAEAAEAEVISEFSLEGAYLGRLTGADTPAGGFDAPISVAVDQATHHVFVGDYRGEGGGVIDVFGADLVIPDVSVEPASSVKTTSATLAGTVDPDKAGDATCQFNYGTSKSFGQVAPCSTSVPEGASPVPVQVALIGLEPDTTYYYRLQATNVNGTNSGEVSEDGEFTTSGPGLDGESASSVASTSATLDATINPRNAPTTYYFQYGTTTGYGSEAPLLTDISPYGQAVGSGEGDVESGQHIQGLLPATTYHYRVVAVSELASSTFEAFDGPDQTFTTQTVGGELRLPDSRQWEMVSPPEKHGALFLPLGSLDVEGLEQASVNGNRISYVADAPTEAEPQGYDNGVQILSTRGSDGWSSQTITPPHEEATDASVGKGAEYRFFSEDLSSSIVQSFSISPLLSPEATEQTPYLRTDYLSGEVGVPCVDGCYRPLVSATNVPSGTKFDEASIGECKSNVHECGPYFLGGTPDLSHVLLGSPVALTSEPAKDGLYEWAEGRLQLVSVLPVGETNQEGGMTASSPVLGEKNKAARNAISNDGSRVIWEGETIGSDNDHLYLRNTVEGETVRLDLPQGGVGTGESRPTYMTASSDGSRIFFLDEAGLTLEASTGGGVDLYEYNLNAPAGSRLTDLTADKNPSEAAGAVAVLGTSEDGSYVYFAASGALAGEATPGECGGNSPEPGNTTTCNLYVRHSGTTTFIAALSQEDFPDWAEGSAVNLFNLTARVSPSGRWLAFQSQRDLVGYDTSDAISGKPDEEVYLYDASAQKLVCASCNPTGARPVGVEYKTGTLVGADRLWAKQTWLDAEIPPWTRFNLTGARYQSRYLSDSGRLFFDSDDGLVPQDVNGAQDVYEYEPPSVGDCTTSLITFSERSGGCVGLISSGTSSGESAFLDTSESGGDVFFLTAAKLVSQDFDKALDVYDAHECTAGEQCFASSSVSPPPCGDGESCKPSPTPQPAIFGSPSSATFSGTGNTVVRPVVKPAVKQRSLTRAQKLARALKSCRGKRSRKKRAVCERQARKRYGAERSGKANAKKKGVR